MISQKVAVNIKNLVVILSLPVSTLSDTGIKEQKSRRNVYNKNKRRPVRSSFRRRQVIFDGYKAELECLIVT